MFYASEKIHRNRHRHRRRQNNSPSPSPSPPEKKIFTVTVTVTAEEKKYHRHRNRGPVTVTTVFSPAVTDHRHALLLSRQCPLQTGHLPSSRFSCQSRILCPQKAESEPNTSKRVKCITLKIKTVVFPEVVSRSRSVAVGFLDRGRTF